MSRAVLLGPYVGDFANEITTFRPYMKYVSQIVDPDVCVYISSHTNRSFLYDWIPVSNFIPIYEHISRNELCQNGFIHSDITKTEFNQITKFIRSQIPHDDVEVQTLPYVKSVNSISLYQKIFKPFTIPNYNIKEEVEVVGIFDNSEQSRNVYDIISKRFDVTVLGDMNNGLEYHNILLKNIKYLDNYLIMFNYIKKAKMVVTNCSEWVIICNLQKIPVFYWGPDFSLYKGVGVMNFENKKCMSLCSMDTDSISSMILYHFNNIGV